MSIVITPNVTPVAAQAVTTADIVLQPGSVISARVVQILGNDQVRIAIGGQPIEVTSQVPLQAGQTLQLQVSQTASGIGLAIVSQSGAAASQGAGSTATLDSVTLAPNAAAIAALAPPGTPVASNPLSALETLAVALAAQTAATQQTSLAPLFANLGAAAGLAALPPQVQQAMAQVLAQQTSLDQNLTGGDIQQAFRNSGLFLEASLASGSALPTATPDLKAALIVLRQVLTTSLGSVSAGTLPGTPGTPAAALTAQAAMPPAAVAQAATAMQTVTQQAATALGDVVATLVPPGTTPAIVASAQAGQSTLQLSEQSVTIVAGPQTPAIVSPPIAPSLAPATTASATSTQAAPLAVIQEILDLGATNQIVAPASTPADAAARAAVSSAALNLLQEAVQAGPLTAGSPTRLVFENGQMLSLMPAVTGTRAPAIDDPEFARTNLPPPPINGALPSAQPVMPATLVAHAPVEATLQHLLTDTDGAIARQTLLQVASLPGQADTTAGRLDHVVPRWNFEIPFATPQGTAMAQFEISRDGGGREPGGAVRPVWRARFSLDVEPAGPVHAQVALSGERTSVRMWAERPATAAQLRAGVSQLSQALSRAELQPSDIVVRDGAPLQPASAPAGHFLDRVL